MNNLQKDYAYRTWLEWAKHLSPLDRLERQSEFVDLISQSQDIPREIVQDSLSYEPWFNGLNDEISF